MTGIVKKKTDRGFGFISIEGQDKDLFFHSSALVGVSFDALQEGATVTFDVENGDNGRQSAKNVQLAGQGDQTDSSEVAKMSEESTPTTESAPTEEE